MTDVSDISHRTVGSDETAKFEWVWLTVTFVSDGTVGNAETAKFDK